VQVYWEFNCVNVVDHIDWGILYPGESKSFTVYVRNKGISPFCYIYVWDYSWFPDNAERLMCFSWSGQKKVNLYEVVPVVFSLEVSQHIWNVSEFSFYITVLVSDHNVLGDINRDGVVDIYDVIVIGAAYNTSIGDAKWNSEADLNGDWTVNMYDLVIVCFNYGIGFKS